MFDKKDLNMKRWILPAFALGTIFMAACSDSGSDTAGTSEEAEGITAVTDWEVAGVSQKGPFVTGSAVTVQELDGITLKQTGKSFKGSIKSDKGDFAIKDINLKSQYAILEASGYYRDEISGKKSSAPVTLRALTDLSNRKTVNINLLTHLEYERVSYLVADKKMPIADAKAQAESEVFASFAIEGEFAESEDLNIFKSGDGNAALLAVSVLLQSDVDVAGLTERMGEFSIALAEGGSWDDADTKTAIADWACDVDLKGSLKTIRKNVEGWKYADSVPAFEKYVTNFWWNNYGLGACNDKRENETKRNVNKLSKHYNEYFVCEKGRWVIPSDEPESSSSKDVSSSSGNGPSSSSAKTVSSSSEVSSSSYYDPFVKQSSSSVFVKKDSLPDLPDEVSFVEKYFDQRSQYTEYADGKQLVWWGRSPYYWQIGGQREGVAAPWDSAASALIREATDNGFEYLETYPNDSLDNVYTNESHVYSKTAGGKVYKIVITMGDVSMPSMASEDCLFYLKVIVYDGDMDEIPSESRKDYNSPQYRDLPEDLKFIEEAVEPPNRIVKNFSNDSMWTSWTYAYLTDTYGTDNWNDAKAKADEYAEMMETHGFTLVSKKDYSLEELETKGYFSGTNGSGIDAKSEMVTLYRYEKEVEGFRYEAEVFPSVNHCVGIIMWYETRANIKITIYDK